MVPGTMRSRKNKTKQNQNLENSMPASLHYKIFKSKKNNYRWKHKTTGQNEDRRKQCVCG